MDQSMLKNALQVFPEKSVLRFGLAAGGNVSIKKTDKQPPVKSGAAK
ncbi:MAG: hypothetical protein PHP98_09655 [Kiritimatiellae bacterium]|jgi:hypothetical protein|nr:hypothetical protein [Kiritimatiellia bacterium]